MDATAANDLLARLQAWYLSQCNGDWEHAWGVKINTLDNPGWSIDVNLEDTELEGCEFAPVEHGTAKADPNEDWLVCRVQGNVFEGRGGPRKLAEMIAIFLTWAESH